jgi:hypothetical protein
MKAHLLPRKSQSAQLGRATIGLSDPDSALLGRSIWRLLRGRVALGGRFPGLKPWAEFCSPPSGHKQGLSPRSVAYSLSEQIPERRPGYRASPDIA